MAAPLHAIRFPFAIDAGAGALAQESDYETYIRQLIRRIDHLHEVDAGHPRGSGLFAQGGAAVEARHQSVTSTLRNCRSPWATTV